MRDQPLECVHEPASQGLAPEERPLLETRAAFELEAREEIASIKLGGPFEVALFAGALKRLGIDIDLQLRLQAKCGPIRSNSVGADGEMQFMECTPQPRSRGRLICLWPQQCRQ